LAAAGEFLYGQLLAEVVPEALMQAQKFVAGFEILPSNTTTALIYAPPPKSLPQDGCPASPIAPPPAGAA
jgi:hypothetical protein